MDTSRCSYCARRKESDHLLTHTCRGGTEAHEDLGGDALTLADETEEYVLGADVVVAELQCLPHRQLQDLLRPGGEWRGAGAIDRRPPNDLLNLLRAASNEMSI